MDTLLGQGDHDYRPDWNIFNYAGVDGLTRLFDQPEFIKLYYNQYKDLIHRFYNLHYNKREDFCISGLNLADFFID